MKHPQYVIAMRAVEAYAVTRATLILRPSRRNSERVHAARAEVERELERLVEQATEDKSVRIEAEQGIKEMQTAKVRTETVATPRTETTETGDETRTQGVTPELRIDSQIPEEARENTSAKIHRASS